jgi:hypothetical protein
MRTAGSKFLKTEVEDVSLLIAEHEIAFFAHRSGEILEVPFGLRSLLAAAESNLSFCSFFDI